MLMLMSAVETGQMSAVETRQMSSAETRQMSTRKRRLNVHIVCVSATFCEKLPLPMAAPASESNEPP